MNVTLGHPHALRTLLGTVLFMTVTGILCVALGTIIRSTAGGIATFAGLLFVLPGINAILPSALSDAINPYLPSNAGTGDRVRHAGRAHPLAVGRVRAVLRIHRSCCSRSPRTCSSAATPRKLVLAAWARGQAR